MKLGIAILGAGRWGVHLVRNFLVHPQARVVAVVDPHPEHLQSLPQRLGVDKQGRPYWDDSVVLTSDWAAVLQMPEVEAVAIATPATTHYTLITTALQQGIHVLAEKPLTIDTEQAYELCRLAAQQQRQLVVDQTYLFHPAVEQGKAVIEQGKLGELRYGYASRTNLGPVRHDVDAMWDLAIHDIAIFNNWLGETPSEVQARGTVWLQPGTEAVGTTPCVCPEEAQGVGGDLGDEETRGRGDTGTRRLEIDLEDNTDENLIQNPKSKIQNCPGLSDLVWVTLTYPSGFQAFIHVSWLNPDKQRRLGIVGSQGTLIFDEMLTDAPLSIYSGSLEQKGNQFTPQNQHQEVLNLQSEEPLRRVCNHFLECVRKNKTSAISSGLVGANLVQILQCLTESLQQGGKTVAVSGLQV